MALWVVHAMWCFLLRVLGVRGMIHHTYEMLKNMRSAAAGVAVLITSAVYAPAVVVPFTEDFVANASGWVFGTSNAPTWSATGGVAGGSYISASATIDTNGFGPIVFRGNNANDASGDAFVGDWLAAGVTLFTAYVRHNAPTNLFFYVRLDRGAGNAASSNPLEVAPNTWTQLTIPITNSLGTNGQVFQSYGAAGTNFNAIFTNIQNVQIALSSGQDPVTVGQTYTIDLDQPAVVPEPGTVALLGLALAAVPAMHFWRRRKC